MNITLLQSLSVLPWALTGDRLRRQSRSRSFWLHDDAICICCIWCAAIFRWKPCHVPAHYVAHWNSLCVPLHARYRPSRRNVLLTRFHAQSFRSKVGCFHFKQTISDAICFQWKHVFQKKLSRFLIAPIYFCNAIRQSCWALPILAPLTDCHRLSSTAHLAVEFVHKSFWKERLSSKPSEF